MAHIHELYDFTTSAFVIHPKEPKILLLLHKKLGKWLQPGGHVELNENPLQTLHHEMLEETGLNPTDYVIIEPSESPRPKGNNRPLPLPFYFNEHNFNETHKHIDICYLAKASITKLTTEPDGASDIGWFTIAQINKHYAAGKMFVDTKNICKWIAARYF